MFSLLLLAGINAEEMTSQAILLQLISASHLFVETMQRVSPLIIIINCYNIDIKYILDAVATLRYVMSSECTFNGSIKINNEVSTILIIIISLHI